MERDFRCDGQLETAEAVVKFALAGHAFLTVVSRKTGNRFTYRIDAPVKDDKRDLSSDFRFVSVLTGPDNTSSYKYFGYVRRGVYFFGTKKSKVTEDAPSVRAFDWLWRKVSAGVLPADVEVWHEGRCGRCGRQLTVPESVASGFGPECAGRLA